MRVDNVTINPNPDPTPAQAVAAQTNSASTEAAGSAAQSTTEYAPTSELLQLLSVAHASPPVRPEVISNIASRLGLGEFTSSQAAAEAATNLLRLASGE